MTKKILSGNEAIARGFIEAGGKLAAAYPGTPSTEVLETLSCEKHIHAEWSVNEKVALEVTIGGALAGVRSMACMKHVGVNVAADPLFTAAYTGAPGALVVVSADDPGMASSQNEQDNRRYAVAAGLPMLEPADSQEAYDFALRAVQIAQTFQIPVLLRLTTRICHSRTVVKPSGGVEPAAPPAFVRDIRRYVMVPANARLAHRKLRAKLAEIALWNEQSALNPA